MHYLITTCVVLLTVASVGCNSLTSSARNASNSLKQATSPLRESLSRVAGTENDAEIVHWDWTLGIPIETPRGEVLAAHVPPNAVAQLLPHLTNNNIRLVSTAQQFAGYEIRNIDGNVIRHCADLYSALDDIAESNTHVQVDLAPVGSSNADQEIATRVDHPTLQALVQATTPDTSAFRISEGGNPTYVIRDGGIRCQVVLRVERSRGMIQLVMSAVNCWGDETLLPVDVRCHCRDQPLQCLTVADTLELLYGNGEIAVDDSNPSFAEVSEREDYLLPVNYKRLSERERENKKLTTQSPAFASLQGMRYPGPALLGDARALTGIMLQQERLKRGEKSKTGWLIFAGDSVHSAEHVDVSLDLGSGAKTYRFIIPAAH